jgi:hypothetical protein
MANKVAALFVRRGSIVLVSDLRLPFMPPDGASLGSSLEGPIHRARTFCEAEQLRGVTAQHRVLLARAQKRAVLSS